MTELSNFNVRQGREKEKFLRFLECFDDDDLYRAPQASLCAMTKCARSDHSSVGGDSAAPSTSSCHSSHTSSLSSSTWGTAMKMCNRRMPFFFSKL